MYADFERFSLSMTLEQALSASHPGDCTAEVAVLAQAPEISAQLSDIPAAYLRTELAEYGAWDENELADHAANQQRILWIAAGNIREEHLSGERA